MVEEFDLLEEVEVQFCDEECTESVWHSMARSGIQRKLVLPGETEVGTDGSHQRGRHDVLPDY